MGVFRRVIKLTEDWVTKYHCVECTGHSLVVFLNRQPRERKEKRRPGPKVDRLGWVWVWSGWVGLGFGHTKLGPCLIEPLVGFERRVNCSSARGRGRQ